MFLHTNLSPKWNLRIPSSSSDLKRRWEVLQPGGRAFREALSFDPPAPSGSSDAASPSNSSAVDLEGEVFDFLAALSCDGALRRYAEEMAARANALRELREAGERREDDELERLEAEEEGRGRQRRQRGRVEEEEKPVWRARAEKRRAERLEEARRRERELQRRRKAALAEASRTRRGGEGEKWGTESTEDARSSPDDLAPPPPLLLSSSGNPVVVTAAEDLLPRGLPAQSFHPINPGVDFAAAFRWGLRGTFEEFTPLTAFDWLLHFVNGGVRPAGRRLRRAVAFVARGGGGYFRPF